MAAVVALRAGGFAMATGAPLELDREGTELSGVYSVAGGNIEPSTDFSRDRR